MQWLTEQCVFVESRNAAVTVWNVLLELGILVSGTVYAGGLLHMV